MVGAIILTAEHNRYTRLITIELPYQDNINNNDKPKNSSFFIPFIDLFKFLYNKIYFIVVNKIDKIKSSIFSLSNISIHLLFDVLINENYYSESIVNNISYYVIFII